MKDTAINIQETGEFVVNLVDMAIAKQMITCGIDFPRGVVGVEKSGLSLAPLRQVRPGRIREAPCSMECRVHQSIDFPRRAIVLGAVPLAAG